MASKSDDEALNPEVIPPTRANASDRNRAYRIKKTIDEGGSPSPEDLAWYTEYERGKRTRQTAARSKKVTFTSEEQESVGTTLETAAALAAPQLAREEGRRIDSLIRESTNATASMAKVALQACEMVMKFGGMVLERNGKLESNNIGMLETFRKSHTEMTHAHAQLVRQQAEFEADDIVRAADEAAKENDGNNDMIEGILAQFMPLILGEMAKRSKAPKGESNE